MAFGLKVNAANNGYSIFFGRIRVIWVGVDRHIERVGKDLGIVQLQRDVVFKFYAIFIGHKINAAGFAVPAAEVLQIIGVNEEKIAGALQVDSVGDAVRNTCLLYTSDAADDS